MFKPFAAIFSRSKHSGTVIRKKRTLLPKTPDKPISIEQATDDKSTEKQEPLATDPSRPTVSFNLKKLSSLAGHEKIDIFRDFLKARQLKNAVVVYQKLHENGIIARLRYSDHSQLFKQLASRQPKKYKDDILAIGAQMSRLAPPTPHYLETLIDCACEWKDLNVANAALTELRVLRPLKLETANALMGLLAQFGVAQWKQGLEIWQDLVDRNDDLTATSYGRVLSLYTLLGNLEKADQIYTDAMSKYSADESLEITTFYMAALCKSSVFPKARQLFDQMTLNGYLDQVDKGTTVITRQFFHQALELADLTDDSKFALELIHSMRTRGIRLNVTSYSFEIESHGKTSLNDAQSAFERALHESKPLPESVSEALLKSSLWCAQVIHCSADTQSLPPLLTILEQDGIVPEPLSRLLAYLKRKDRSSEAATIDSILNQSQIK